MEESQSHLVYIALGTNLGDREVNLQIAIQALESKVALLGFSRVYETPPWGVLEQPEFLNQVIQAETILTPTELLRFLKRVEKKLGRVKSVRYGPRLIDLDILLYDILILEMPGLIIPHPQLEKRGFVLFPLADLAPDLRHPVSGKTVSQLLEAWIEENGISGIEIFSDA